MTGDGSSDDREQRETEPGPALHASTREDNSGSVNEVWRAIGSLRRVVSDHATILIGGTARGDIGLRGDVRELARRIDDLCEDLAQESRKRAAELEKLGVMYSRGRADFDRAVASHNAASIAAVTEAITKHRMPRWLIVVFATAAVLIAIKAVDGFARSWSWW